MILKNRLDKPFGPFGTAAGFFLFLGGILASWFSIFGILIVIAGAFIAFTSVSAIIDTERKRIRLSNDLFGIIPTGKWKEIKPGMKLGIRKSHRGFKAYTRGTQPVDIHQNDIRIVLMDPGNTEVSEVKKFDSYETARSDLGNLNSLLGLDTV